MCVVGCHKTSYVAFVSGCHTYDMCIVRVAACCSVLQRVAVCVAGCCSACVAVCHKTSCVPGHASSR